MFEGFTETRVDVGEAELLVRSGGTGSPVLLLHGHPRTSATWHRVAPRLVAAGYTVVAPDLRGYGRSTGPASTPDHAPYSKRATAGDLAALMTRLGHGRFAVVGHDRGAYVALRLALDHPDRVSHLGVLDAVPISEALARCDARFAAAWWHWFFYAQPDVPERAIGADPEAWYHPDAARMGEENYREWRAAVHDPAVVHAMLEDYRAGLGVDRAHELADREAGRTIACPVLHLWSTDDDLADLYGDPLAIWRAWAPDLEGGPIRSGHHMAEDNPTDLAAALVTLLQR